MKDIVILPQEFNINAVGEVLETAKKIMSKEDKIILDAQNVEIIDGLGLQLIVAIQKTALMNNVKCQLINAKPTLQKYMSCF